MSKLKSGKKAVNALVDLAQRLGGTHAERMARAAEQGFTTNRLFTHWTTADIPEGVDPSLSGIASDWGIGHGATFFIDNPKVGDTYLPKQWVKSDSPGIRAEYGGDELSRSFDLGEGDGIATVYESGSKAYPAYINFNDYDVWEWGGGPYNKDKVQSAIDEAKAAGKKGVLFKDMRDGGLYALGQTPKANIAAVINPSTVRSPFADFNPANADSPNLLASLTGAAPHLAGGALAAGALAPEEAEAGPLAVGMRRILDERYLSALGGSAPRKGLNELVQSMETGVRPRTLENTGPVNLYDFEGSPYILTQSDRSAAGGEITSLHGIPIDPVDLRGGRDFMFDPPSVGQVWASDPNVVKSLAARAGRLADETGEEPLLIPYSMAPTGIDFATMPLETMISYARASMGKANINKLDKKIRGIIPEWKGIQNPESVAAFRSVKGPARKQIADLIDKDFRDVRGGMSISEARAATSDAAQYLSPDGQIVNIGRIDTSRPVIADSGHPTYIGGLPGEGVGKLVNPIDVRPFLAQNGRQLTGDAADIRALSMNHGLSQGVINEPLLRSIYGHATPAAMAGTAAVTGGLMASPFAFSEAQSEFMSRRQQKKSMWDTLRQEAMNIVGQGFDALDMPLRGYVGVTGALGTLAAGGTWDQAIAKGAKGATTDVWQTFDDITPGAGNYLVSTGAATPAQGRALGNTANIGLKAATFMLP